MKTLLAILLVIALNPLSYAMGLPVLKVGTLDFYPPYVTRIQSTGGFSGYDMDMMNEICRRIQRQCEFSGYRFEALFPLIEAKDLDIAIGGILITSERREIMAFSEPYSESYVVFLVKASADGKQVDSGSGKIGMLAGMLPTKTIKALNIDPKDVKGYEKLDDLISDLASGVISSAVMDMDVAEYWVNSSNMSLVVQGKKITIGQGYGIAMSKDNVQLREEINQALTDMQNDGTFIKLYNSYFGGN